MSHRSPSSSWPVFCILRSFWEDFIQQFKLGLGADRSSFSCSSTIWYSLLSFVCSPLLTMYQALSSKFRWKLNWSKGSRIWASLAECHTLDYPVWPLLRWFWSELGFDQFAEIELRLEKELALACQAHSASAHCLFNLLRRQFLSEAVLWCLLTVSKT